MSTENNVFISNKIIVDLFEILHELLSFASDNFSDILNEQIGNITDQMDVSEEHAEEAFSSCLVGHILFSLR